MADNSPIEWTDATWNPIRGCSRVSEGCRHCYAESVAARFSGPDLPYEGLARRVSLPSGGSEARWTGKVAYAGDATLQQPLKWRRPRRIFVNSMSDLFHENVPEAIIDRVFAVMALCPQHTFQILTKRPERMRSYVDSPETARRVHELACDMVIDEGLRIVLIAPGVDERLAPAGQRVYLGRWPLANVWLGVSVEDQATAETRIPYLLQTPAAVRFLSCEPLLGPIDLGEVIPDPLIFNAVTGLDQLIHWVIVGGESGGGARPMHPDWARSLRDQCMTAGVPFFFKQWGEWSPRDWKAEGATHAMHSKAPHYGPFQALGHTAASIERTAPPSGWQAFARARKSSSGRVLDEKTHDEFPS
jgi:protein gp37